MDSLNVIINMMDGQRFTYAATDNDNIDTLREFVESRTRFVISLFTPGIAEELIGTTRISSIEKPIILFALGSVLTETTLLTNPQLLSLLKYGGPDMSFDDIICKSTISINGNRYHPPPIRYHDPPIISLYQLRYFHNIRSLSISNVRILYLSSLSYINALDTLLLCGCLRCNNISSLTNVKELTIRRCIIPNIISLNELPNLRVLNIHNFTTIKSIDLGRHTPNLKEIRLSHLLHLTTISLSNQTVLNVFNIHNIPALDISYIRNIQITPS